MAFSWDIIIIVTQSNIQNRDNLKQNSPTNLPQMQPEDDIKIFTCPFNGYHKLFDKRKHQFHMARCKDRRGKSLYNCKFYHMHIYTSIEELLQHEVTCDRKPLKVEEDQMILDPVVQEERFPSATYCKYNYEHVFKTMGDREFHEMNCPNKAEMEVKLSVS